MSPLLTRDEVAISDLRAKAVAVLVAGAVRQYLRLSKIDMICRMSTPAIFFSYAREDQTRVAPYSGEARGARLVGVLGPAHPRGPDLA